MNENPLKKMDKSILVTTLFVDIGGVLLTDGWEEVKI